MIRFPILIALICCCATPAMAPEFSAQAGKIYLHPNVVDVGPVQDEPIAEAEQHVRAIAQSGRKEITLRIDSPGGSIFLGNQFIREMEDLKKQDGLHVTCVVDGMAYSMAAVILESTLCDARLATKRSTILFHNGSGQVQGNAEEMRRVNAFLEALNTAMALVVSDRLGMKLDDYQQRIAHSDWVMATPDAMEHNVIDGYAFQNDIAPPDQATASTPDIPVRG